MIHTVPGSGWSSAGGQPSWEPAAATLPVRWPPVGRGRRAGWTRGPGYACCAGRCRLS